MLDFLFNGVEMVGAIKSLVITAGVIIIAIIILRALRSAGMIGPMMKVTGKVLSILLVFAVLGSGAYSIAYLNSYYNREGGIYGKLTDTVYNSIELVKNESIDNETITYDFDNLVFKMNEDDGKYSIVFKQQYEENIHKQKFLDGTKYSIFVINNDQEYECNDISYDTEWIHSEYSYVFYNSYKESEVLGDDTLTFDFCFYDNYSYLKITSDADESVIQLWDAYFNKYNFKVVIKVVDEVFIPGDMTVDSVEEGFVKIAYYIGDKLYKRDIVPTSSGEYLLPTDGIDDNKLVSYWEDKNGNKVKSISLSKSSSTEVYAVFADWSLVEKHAFISNPTLGEISSHNIWTDGVNYYDQTNLGKYKFNKELQRWVSYTFDNVNDTRCIWSDGKNTYYFEYGGSNQYILNPETLRWEAIENKIQLGQLTWGNYFWSDGENVYYSEGQYQYVLNKETSTWEEKTWHGQIYCYEIYGGYSENGFNGSDVWTDGVNIYCSYNSKHYVLNKETSTWTGKTWNGLTEFDASGIWTDGVNTYYSTGTTHYILNKSNSTWLLENSLTELNIYAKGIWSDGEDVYYTYGNYHYCLLRTKE